MLWMKKRKEGNDMKLLEMHIRDFKGVHDLRIDFGGRDVNIYGANASGKTTIYDAFLWLLFDRDSSNRKEFAVKPRGPDGEEIHHLQTWVEGRISCDGAKIILKKLLQEKWIKKRGESVRTYAGNETEYLMDGVPCNKGEYQARIAGIIDEDTFRLITNPGHFNAAVRWQERREKLFELAGYLKREDETMALLPAFASIRDFLKGRSVQEARRTLQFSLKKLKEEIETIPVRMDETRRGMPKAYEWDATEGKREKARERLEKVERELASARAIAWAGAARICRIENIRRRMKERTEAIRLDAFTKKRESDFELENLRMQIERYGRQKEEVLSEMKNAEREAALAQKEAGDFKKKLDSVLSAKFVLPERAGICTLCGQALPGEMARAEAQRGREVFEERKEQEAGRLRAQFEEAAQRGKSLHGKAEKAKVRAEEFEKTGVELKEWEKKLEQSAEKTISIPEPESDEEYRRLAKLLEEEEGCALPESDGKIDELLEQKRAAADEIFCIERALAVRAQAMAAQQRLGELSREKERLLLEAGKKEQMLDDLEKFAAYKCSLMERKINEMFGSVKWKLFDLQINGGVSECCECLIGGVPYADANSGARINSGLEIIDVFSRKNKVSAPIFIDNRESIGALFPVNAQVVNLIVSREESLRIEPAGNFQP
jgi:AAA15 family ATPase/GTPase